MIPRSLLSGLNYKKLFSLSGLFFRHPFMLIPTLKATKDCIDISDKLFPGLHHLNNNTNAFRHALWNMLLTKEAYIRNNDINKALHWAQIIGDWHEEFSPNKPLEKAMDLHNNAFGRELIYKLYRKNDSLKTEYLANRLLLHLDNSKKVSNIQEINSLKDQMVHLID